MTGAPKRIWLEYHDGFIPPYPSWNGDEARKLRRETAEYVRADMVDDLLRELTDARKELEWK